MALKPREIALAVRATIIALTAAGVSTGRTGPFEI